MQQASVADNLSAPRSIPIYIDADAAAPTLRAASAAGRLRISDYNRRMLIAFPSRRSVGTLSRSTDRRTLGRTARSCWSVDWKRRMLLIMAAIGTTGGNIIHTVAGTRTHTHTHTRGRTSTDKRLFCVGYHSMHNKLRSVTSTRCFVDCY